MFLDGTLFASSALSYSDWGMFLDGMFLDVTLFASSLCIILLYSGDWGMFLDGTLFASLFSIILPCDWDSICLLTALSYSGDDSICLLTLHYLTLVNGTLFASSLCIILLMFLDGTLFASHCLFYVILSQLLCSPIVFFMLYFLNSCA